MGFRMKWVQRLTVVVMAVVLTVSGVQHAFAGWAFSDSFSSSAALWTITYGSVVSNASWARTASAAAYLKTDSGTHTASRKVSISNYNSSYIYTCSAQIYIRPATSASGTLSIRNVSTGAIISSKSFSFSSSSGSYTPITTGSWRAPSSQFKVVVSLNWNAPLFSSNMIYLDDLSATCAVS